MTRTRTLLLLLPCLLALTAALATAAVKDPLTAFGSAKLGASLADVKKAYPKMEALAPMANLGAQGFVSDHLARFVVRNAQVPELKRKADVELRFWKDKLWAYIVYYGDGNDQAVVETLTKRFGPPNGTNPQKPSWAGETSTTFVETSQHWYSVTDNAISKDAAAWFVSNLQQLQSGMKAPAAPAAAPPAAAAATPPAAATPATAATPGK